MSDFKLGEHEAKLDSLEGRTERIETSMSRVHTKLDAITTTLAERRGERKTIAILATVAGGLGSVLVTVLLKVFER